MLFATFVLLLHLQRQPFAEFSDLELKLRETEIKIERAIPFDGLCCTSEYGSLFWLYLPPKGLN